MDQDKVKKMTITRGLVQLKLLDKRILKAMKESFITYKIGDEVKDKKSTPQAAIDSVKGLIARRDNIKAAIMAANSVTKITIVNEEMTIAAALEKKKSIGYLTELLKTMERQFRQNANEIEQANASMQTRLDILLEANFGKDLKARADEVEAITKSFTASNKAEAVDPIELETRIKELWEYIEEFKSEIDLLLSEANAVTEIELD